MISSRALTVVDPGPLTTVQDLGRPGWAHLGVPRAGALDAPSAALANRLVGNPEQAAVLETTVGGVSFRVSAAVTLAVTGAAAYVVAAGRTRGFAEPFTVPAGATVRVGQARTGVRSYVAVAGGIDVAPVLGSRSTDTLSWTGPPRVTSGVELPVGPPIGEPRGVDVAQVRRFASPVELRCVLGPRADRFTDGSLATWSGAAYTVSDASNRIGLRLRGPALAHTSGDELASEGLVLGSVQVPPSGEPVVFLHDHPTTGGYPVVAVVEPADLAACAQLRPGDGVRFRVVDG